MGESGGSPTRPSGTRQDVLAVLWGQEPLFRLNADALAWLDATRISRALVLQLCAALPWDTDLSTTTLTAHLLAAEDAAPESQAESNGAGPSTSGETHEPKKPERGIDEASSLFDL